MLTILYRGCDKELEYPPSRQGRPSWFSKINNFKTIHNSITNSTFRDKIKLIALMDGEKSELTDYISSLKYDIIYVNANSNNASLKYQLNFSKQFDTHLYFLEDDYLHKKDAMYHIMNGLDKFDLVTGYDHYDRYTRNDDISKDKESVFFHEGIHWRTCESTTCTWAASKKIAKGIIPIAEYFLLNDRDFFRYLYTQGIKLHNTIPGVSTHVHEPYMSPGTNWEDINNE